MTHNQFYAIYLEDYSKPRWSSAAKTYYGSKEDIDHFLNLLGEDNHARIRYRETIEAVKAFDVEAEPTYHNIAGQSYPALVPVEPVSKFETRVTNQLWNYATLCSRFFPCKADVMDICQILVRVEDGYERCIKCSMPEFHCNIQFCSWLTMCDSGNHFPGVVTWDGTAAAQNLYASVQHYGFKELDAATKDLAKITQPLFFKKSCGLLNGFGKLLLLQMFRHIDFEKIDRVPHFAGAEQRIDRRQNHSGNGDNGSFLASALGDALIFQYSLCPLLVFW